LSINSFIWVLACSEKAFSLPLKTIWILTLLFFFRNLTAWLALNSKSPSPVLGRKRIPFSLVFFCFLLFSYFFLVSRYWNFPQSISLHTGGSALGAISTKSKPESLAKWRASWIGKIPCCSPLSPTTLISWTPLIASLTRFFGFFGVGLYGVLLIVLC
jgi:hypothetical protein